MCRSICFAARAEGIRTGAFQEENDTRFINRITMMSGRIDSVPTGEFIKSPIGSRLGFEDGLDSRTAVLLERTPRLGGDFLEHQ